MELRFFFFVIVPMLAMLWLLTRLLGCRGRRPPLLLLLAAPLLMFVFRYVGSSRTEVSRITDQYNPPAVARFEVPPADPHLAGPANSPQPLEELWNELHPVKIDLSEETAKTQADGESGEELPPRPAWVDRPPRQVGEVYQRSVSAGPWPELRDCYRQLEEKLRVVVAQRVEKLAADDGRRAAEGQIASLAPLGLDVEYVLNELCTDKYVENVEGPGFEDSKKVYVLLEFTEADDQRLLARWEQRLRQQRVGEVGAGAAIVLAGLALLYGLLKVNLAAIGRGAKRLFARPSAAIIAVAALILAV